MNFVGVRRPYVKRVGSVVVKTQHLHLYAWSNTPGIHNTHNNVSIIGLPNEQNLAAKKSTCMHARSDSWRPQNPALADSFLHNS